MISGIYCKETGREEMSGIENGDEYFDSLCELDNYSQANFEKLQDVLKTLLKLLKLQSSTIDTSITTRNVENEDTTNAIDDNIIIKLLDTLSRDFDLLIETSIALKQAKYQAREAQIQCAEAMETDNHTRLNKSPFGKDLTECVDVLECIQRDSLRYTNLIDRMSVDLVKQVEVSDPNVSRVDMESWKPSKELQEILDQYSNTDRDLSKIDDDLKDYLDQIKLSRAKYTLENKYQLQTKLNELNNEINQWRKECNNMESLMFGDDPRSMKSMLRTIGSLKQRLIDEREQDCGTNSSVDDAGEQRNKEETV